MNWRFRGEGFNMKLQPYASAMTTTHIGRRHVSRGRGRQTVIERLESRVLLSGGILSLQGNSAAITNGESSPSQSNFTDFGPTAANGSVPLTRSYTITNTGTGALDTTQPTAVTVSGTNASDFAVTTQPAATIAASGTSAFEITYTPVAAGVDTATVTIASDASNAPSFTFHIQGTALATTTQSDGLQYATTAAGSGAATQDGELLLMNYSGYLTDGTEFDSNTNPTFSHVWPFEFNLGAGSVIQGWDEGLLGALPGESRTLIIPSSLGYGASGSGSIPGGATLIFTTTLLNVVSLDGQVNSSNVFIADGDTSISAADGTYFGQVASSAPAVTHTFVINEASGGLSSLLATPAITLSGTDASAFSVTQPVINGGGTQATFTVTYPPSAGISTATVTINNANAATDSDPNLTFNVQGEEPGTGTLTLTGNSTAINSGETSPTESNFTDFGGEVVGSKTPVTRSYTITNSASYELDLSGPVAISGADPGDFTVSTAPSSTIAADANTTFDISFTPAAVGLRTATVTIASNDPNSPFTFAIEGTGNDLTVLGNSSEILPGEGSPSLSNFTDFGPTTADGTVPLTRTYTITNNTSAQINFDSPAITITGDTGDFSVTQPTGTGIAANYGTATFAITFTPTAAGLRTATVTIGTNDSQIPSYTFDIQGTALNATTEAGGLEVDTTIAGSGPVSQDGDLLIMDYSGYLTDGTEFDSNVDATFGHVNPFEFNLGAGKVIKGWDEGLAGVQAGASLTLIIPSTLGYGASGSGSIPGNATLIFTTKVLNFVSLDGVVNSSNFFIADGDTSISTTDGTDFGKYNGSQPAVTHSFAINESPGALNSFVATPAITLAGLGASSFSVTQPTISSDGTQATFTVTYTPSPGISTATVTINNANAASDNDPNLTFNVQGQGVEEAVGAVTAANQTEITGWAYDPVNPTESIKVEIFIDSVLSQTVSADQTLDSLQTLIGSTNHGFTYGVPVLSAGSHAVSVYAIDTTTGNNDLIGTGTIVYPVTPDSLSFTQQPTDTGAGDAISPAIRVTAIAPGGSSADTSFNGAVTIHLLEAGTLLGTTTVTAVNGVATFSGLSLDQAGTFAFVASAAGANPGYSSAFDVGAEVATHLAFIYQPASFWQYSSMASPVLVASEDRYGNFASAGGPAQITLGVASKPAGAVVSGTATKTAIDGVAAFMGITANLPGTYVLIARSGSLTSATSNAFAVVPVPVSERFSFSGIPLSAASLAFQQLRDSAAAPPTYAQALEELVGDVAVPTAAATFAASPSVAISTSTASPLAISASDSNLESQLLDGGSPDQTLLN
jgi:FKBP-type peptidyl-prolyl cis-trans isomerase